MYINSVLSNSDTGDFSKDELLYMLTLQDQNEIKQLLSKAYETKLKFTGRKVFFRGLIEVSNICAKDCYYCGIRRSNKGIERYLMQEEDIINAANFAWINRYGSIVLQSGERSDPIFSDFIEKLIRRIKIDTRGELGITLSLGEQSEETYRRWKEAGAHRYLLRIETSNQELYKKLHPADHDFQKRKACLQSLKKTGYQTGTGVMIRLPFQTYEDLVNDILFFKETDVDMIGMGPFIVSKDTPFARLTDDDYPIKESAFELALKMIAAVRLYLQDVNIAATTALQSLHIRGRELGLQAGANIIMPNVTDVFYKGNYQLYDGKPNMDENADECKSFLESHILEIDEEIGYGEWGDSVHYKKT